MTQHPPEQILQWRRREQPRHIAQSADVAVIGSNGVRLAAGAVESEHESLTEPVVIRVLDDDRLEFANHVCVTRPEVGIDTSCKCSEALGIETGDLSTSPREPLKPFVGASPPQRQRLTKRMSPTTFIAVLDQQTANPSFVGEGVGVDQLRSDRQLVAVSVTDEDRRTERPAQVGDVCVNRRS